MAPPSPAMPRLGRVPASWKSAPTAQLIADVAIALTAGATLISKTHTVGRRCIADSDSLEFECVDRDGNLEESLEIERRAVSLWECDETARQDWTAFGAAAAFVRAVGKPATQRALRALHDGMDAVGIDPGVAKRPAPRRSESHLSPNERSSR